MLFNQIEAKAAIKHLLEVKERSVKQIEFAKRAQYAINIKQSYDDVSSIDIAVSSIEKVEKAKTYCKDKMRVQFETDYSEGYVNGFNMAAREILKILEE